MEPQVMQPIQDDPPWCEVEPRAQWVLQVVLNFARCTAYIRHAGASPAQGRDAV